MTKGIDATSVKGADATSVRQIATMAGPGLSVDDIMRIQRRWAPIVKSAMKPAGLIGQKYV